MKYKNYILLLLIYIFTIIGVIYFCLVYKNSSLNINDIENDSVFVSVMGNNYDKLYNNVSNYSKENHEFVIYVTSHSSVGNHVDDMLRDVVSSFNGSILYIDVDYLKSFNYINKLISDYGYNSSLSISKLPVLFVFHDDHIDDIVSIGDYDYDTLHRFLEGFYD